MSKQKDSSAASGEENVNIEVQLDDDVSQGFYSNLALSNFSQEEFILDFAFLQPHLKKAKVSSRVLLSPRNAKRLFTMLKDNIQKYEAKYGAISDNPNQPGGIQLSVN